MKKITWVLPLFALAMLSSTNLYSAKRVYTAEDVANILNNEKARTNFEQLQQTLEKQGITLNVKKPSRWNNALDFVCNLFQLVGVIEIFAGLIENSPHTFFEGFVTIGGAEFIFWLLKEDDATVFLDWYPIN